MTGDIFVARYKVYIYLHMLASMCIPIPIYVWYYPCTCVIYIFIYCICLCTNVYTNTWVTDDAFSQTIILYIAFNLFLPRELIVQFSKQSRWSNYILSAAADNRIPIYIYIYLRAIAAQPRRTKILFWWTNKTARKYHTLCKY